jgi:hypothetical protein
MATAKVLIFAARVAFVTSAPLAFAQSDTAALCQKVLIPTNEQAATDYRKLQAYMLINSSYEYDKLHTLDVQTRGGEASYKGSRHQTSKIVR